MSGVRLLVGTRKGGFVLTSDGRRERWDVSGPHFAGWEIYHVKGSPLDPNRIWASQSTSWFGQLIQRSSDGGRTWEPVGNEFVYDGVPGTHQWYDGTPHPWAFALVNDFRAWPRWSPYEKKDPAMQRTLGGAQAGAGATYAWDGNDDVGAGGMMITESVPGRRVAIRLEFSRPMVANNDVVFTFEDAGGATRVVWGMDGRNGFLGKLVSLLLDMDAMVGTDFEAGLAALESAAEADAARPTGPAGSR